MDKKMTGLLILTGVFCCGVMAAVVGLLDLSYGMETAAKIGLFMLVPFALSLWDRRVSIQGMFKFQKKGILVALFVSLVTYGLILTAYFAAGRIFDMSRIAGILYHEIDVTPDNYLYVAAYISLFNSLLEEFFFRGLLFTNLKRSGTRRLAYGFSAGLFALYHVSVMAWWRNPLIHLLVLVALAAAGVFFNWLYEKYDTLYAPWFVHMAASLAVNIMGLKLMV